MASSSRCSPIWQMIPPNSSSLFASTGPPPSLAALTLWRTAGVSRLVQAPNQPAYAGRSPFGYSLLATQSFLIAGV